jgi:hypothetical protein
MQTLRRKNFFPIIVEDDEIHIERDRLSYLKVKSCQKMGENKITNNKIQITNKSQTTNYKSQT